MKAYSIQYTTSTTDFTEVKTITFPCEPSVDLTDCDDEKLVEIVSSFANIPDDVGVAIINVVEGNLKPGDLALLVEPEYEIEVHADGTETIKNES